jgi:hypothetical protein
MCCHETTRTVVANTKQCVGVSAATGAGFDTLFAAVLRARNSFITEYRPAVRESFLLTNCSLSSRPRRVIALLIACSSTPQLQKRIAARAAVAEKKQQGQREQMKRSIGTNCDML